jgi:hypothetical protein
MTRRIKDRVELRADSWEEPSGPRPEDHLRKIAAWRGDDRTRAEIPFAVEDWGDSHGCLWVRWPLPGLKEPGEDEDGGGFRTLSRRTPENSGGWESSIGGL